MNSMINTPNTCPYSIYSYMLDLTSGIIQI